MVLCYISSHLNFDLSSLCRPTENNFGFKTFYIKNFVPSLALPEEHRGHCSRACIVLFLGFPRFFFGPSNICDQSVPQICVLIREHIV